MKRFYESASCVSDGRGWRVVLDDRPVRTPSGRDLVLPAKALAEAISAEWEAQTGEIAPVGMPLTRLANTALDRTASLRETIIEEIAGYGGSDLLCYRVAEPEDLAVLQREQWDPLLDWVEDAYSAPLSVTVDLAPVEQANGSLLAIYSAVARQNDFVLTGLQAATGLCGSVVLGLALVDGRIDAEAASRCALLEEMHQAERWGADEEIERRWRAIQDELAAAATFMSLSRD